MCCFKASLSSPRLRKVWHSLGKCARSFGGMGGTREAAVRFAERGGVANDSAAGKLISDGSGDSARRSGQPNRALALGSRAGWKAAASDRAIDPGRVELLLNSQPR